MIIAAYIGFGEAGQAFAHDGNRAFDIKVTQPATAAAKRCDYASAGVIGCESAEQALAGTPVVLSLVTADQALVAAMACAPFLAPDALWLDMNSVAPGTKRAAAAAVEAAGGRYVDVAVMAPVEPARRDVPLRVSGPHRAAAIDALGTLGFSRVADGGANVGDASAVKMIRSVLVKGIEALTAEAALAAHRAGVAEAVFASLDQSAKAEGWARRADYNIERMMVHGLRRAAEMEEAAKTLAELGVDPAMTRGTIDRQRAIGRLGIEPPAGLAAKLAILAPSRKDRIA
jgi:3-hydroxyisobutyrate dehydrogenase-like beta-hydroxyacid dehydrogenase